MEMQLTESSRTVVGSKIKLVVGIFFTVVGVLLALDNLDILYAGDVLRFWPVLFIVIGALKFNDAGSRGLAVFSIAAGAVMLAHNTHLPPASPPPFLPLLLLALGPGVVVGGLCPFVPPAGLLSAPIGRT